VFNSGMAEGYGTIFRMRPKPGAEQRIVELMHDWVRERQPKVPGALGAYLFRPDNRPGELLSVAVFRDRESFRANGSDPEQDAWYRRVREQLEADPEWEDGVILFGASLPIS
jgi:quinol monooxygenase YgiN